VDGVGGVDGGAAREDRFVAPPGIGDLGGAFLIAGALSILPERRQSDAGIADIPIRALQSDGDGGCVQTLIPDFCRGREHGQSSVSRTRHTRKLTGAIEDLEGQGVRSLQPDSRDSLWKTAK
jgi:hypothetical protein